jgi:hypothetical protein
VNNTNDFSYNKTFLHTFIQVIGGMCLYLYFEYQGNGKRVLEYVIKAFIIQTLIQWGAFLIPPVRNMVNLFKSESIITMGEAYGGVRALGLAGSNFFGLAVAYGLIFILYWSEHNKLFCNNKQFKFALYLFLITGTFFAGRTGYVGLAVGIAYLLMQKKWKFKISIKEILRNVIFVGSCLIVITEFVKLYNNDLFYSLYRFTFQMFFNKFEKGTFSISSVEILMEDSYFAIPFKTILIGDGRFSATNGAYYMTTDSGYMRVILFMGVVGILLLILMQFLLFIGIKGNEKKLVWAIFIYSLVTQVKGDVIMFAIITTSVMTLYAMTARNNRYNELDYIAQKIR